MNHAVFIARINGQPQRKMTPKGDNVAAFEISVESSRAEDPPIKLRATAYGQVADHVHENIRSGQLVWLQGQMQIYSDANKRKHATMVASRVEALGRSVKEAQ